MGRESKDIINKLQRDVLGGLIKVTENKQRLEREIAGLAPLCGYHGYNVSSYGELAARLRENRQLKASQSTPQTNESNVTAQSLFSGLITGLGCAAVAWLHLPREMHLNIIGSSSTFLLTFAASAYGLHHFSIWRQRSDQERLEVLLKDHRDNSIVEKSLEEWKPELAATAESLSNPSYLVPVPTAPAVEMTNIQMPGEQSPEGYPETSGRV
jgi:hypothetical protein